MNCLHVLQSESTQRVILCYALVEMSCLSKCMTQDCIISKKEISYDILALDKTTWLVNEVGNKYITVFGFDMRIRISLINLCLLRLNNYSP